MLRRYWLLTGVLLIAGIGTAAHIEATPEAQRDKNLTRGEQEAKKLLRLMDKDLNGKVSKTEFMNFMSAEFDRMDKDRSGELDVRELTEAPAHVRAAVHR